MLKNVTKIYYKNKKWKTFNGCFKRKLNKKSDFPNRLMISKEYETNSDLFEVSWRVAVNKTHSSHSINPLGDFIFANAQSLP